MPKAKIVIFEYVAACANAWKARRIRAERSREEKGREREEKSRGEKRRSESLPRSISLRSNVGSHR